MTAKVVNFPTDVRLREFNRLVEEMTAIPMAFPDTTGPECPGLNSVCGSPLPIGWTLCPGCTALWLMHED
jgi:hypothetical protein